MNEVNLEVSDGTLLQSLLARREFIEDLPTGLLLFDTNGTIIDCNGVGAVMLGGEVDQMLGRGTHDPVWRTLREDGSPYPADERPTTITLRTGEPCVDVIVGIDNPGRARRWLSLSTHALKVDGRVTGVFTVCTDVSQRLQRELALRLLTEVNRFIMFATDHADPLQHLCDALVERGNYALAWIGVSSHDEEAGIDIAFSSGLTDYLYAGIASWSGAKETGLGLVGTALRTGVTQVGSGLSVFSPVGPWRERLVEFGLNSAIAIPFRPGGQRAVLAVYDRTSSPSTRSPCGDSK